jgi:ATP-binding cassette subfamily B protein/subfamily B ATP-binding cassette protein MsbA
MKSSRSRFTEFREKLRKGLLKGDRLVDPDAPRSDPPPSMGGRHAAGSGEKHTFKYSKRHLLGQYRVMLRGYYGAVFAMMAVAIISSVVALTPPYVLKLAIDYVFARKPLPITQHLAAGSLRHWLSDSPSHGLLVLVLALIAAEIIGVSISWIRVLAAQKLNYRLAASLRQRLHEHLAQLPLAQLAEYRTGGIISRVMSDTDQVVGGVQNAIVNPVGAIFRMICILLILIATNWKLFAVAAALIPPVVLIHFLIFRRLRPMWRNIQDDRGILSSRVSDLFAGIRVVRSFRRERSEHKEFGARQYLLVRKQYFTSILGRLLATGWSIFVPAIGIIIMWYGGELVLQGKLKVGDLVMFETYSLMLLGPITQMIDSLQNLQQNLGSLDRVCDVLNQSPDMPDSETAIAVDNPLGHLELRDISFGYKPDQIVLDQITLDVPAGATLAVVGPSGSGKTTLVNLIARFYDVRSGAITLDGVDIRDIRLADYRRQFAMVLQDVYLFDGTIMENIGFGRRNASTADIIEAAKKANAHEFIMAMDKGYETPVGERGNKLSGGQKQRISIARAILADPRILILDEATSSLDTQAEKLIQQSLDELMRHRTTIVIAHRLSTIMHADSIAVLVEGKIAEQGTHEELLASNGIYHLMFTQQFDRHRDPALERMEWEKVL